MGEDRVWCERRRRRGRRSTARSDDVSILFFSSISFSLSAALLSAFPLSLTALSRQKTDASLVGARSADESRPCACAPRVKTSEVMAIAKGADISTPSSAHEESALVLLAPAGAPAVTLFICFMGKKGTRRARGMRGARPTPISPWKLERNPNEKMLKARRKGGANSTPDFSPLSFFFFFFGSISSSLFLAARSIFLGRLSRSERDCRAPLRALKQNASTSRARKEKKLGGRSLCRRRRRRRIKPKKLSESLPRRLRRRSSTRETIANTIT